MSPKSFRLMQYHQKLDRKLRGELSRRFPDMRAVQRMKKLKLAVKDRLSAIATRAPKKARPASA